MDTKTLSYHALLMLDTATPAQACEALTYLADALEERADEEPAYQPARVMASAPKMLEALRKALTWMETMKRSDPAITDAGPLARDIAEVRTAIAMAEG